MKVSLKWLRDYVAITLPPSEIARRLTMAGLEAEEIKTVGGDWENIVVGRIVAVNPHPNADRLRLATIDLGAEQPTVVCGAPNLSSGDKVAFARVGAQLVDGYTGEVARLKPAKIRGVVSHGMACSEKELGISDSHEGIMVLPAEATVGTPLADYLGDVILDLAVTPNRPDCLSVIGIAREVAALTGQKMVLPEASYEETALPVDQQISIDIVAPDLCPRYCASLITGIKLADSPVWMQQRLLACGMRPLNNIVDITNYVMLEYGQPLHAFDYQRIRGRKIIVRRANHGENIVSLDGVERSLSPDMLVIADEERAVAVAGVMGGANSEVTGQTTSILLESASFNPASIHYTGRMLRMPSEACMRFERGIRPELTLHALRRATQLIVRLAGGEAAKGVVDVFPGKTDHEPVLLSTGEVKRVLGIGFSLNQIVDTLVSLGFECQKTSSKSEVLVKTPYWRSDINRPVDLIEEVARITGYDKIPSTLLGQPLPKQNPEPIIGLKQEARHGLAGFGFREIITFSLTGREMLNKLLPEPHPLEPEPIRLTNPMTAEQEYLRPNLRASLLAALSTNQRHEESGIRLFELGRVYLAKPDDLPEEPEIVCGVMSGTRLERSWHGNGELLDFYDAKGVVEGLLKRVGVEAGFTGCHDESLHPNKQMAIIAGDNRVGVVGELHPKVSQAFEILGTACLFEINLTALSAFATGHKMFQPIPRFPATVRDIALIVDAGISHQKVHDIIRSLPLVSRVTVFDVYAGEQVPPGKKSLAYSITFQSPTHTLTDDETDHVQQQILDRLTRELGATLRR